METPLKQAREAHTGPSPERDLRRLWVWRVLSYSTFQDSSAGTAIAIASGPYVGATAALVWLGFVYATSIAESLIKAARHDRSLLSDLLMLIRSLAGAGMGLVLVSVPDPDAAIAGVAVWCAMVFRAIVVDYRKPRQLWFRVGPPLAAGVWRQANAALDHLKAGVPQLMATDLSILVLLMAVFATVYMTLKERRRTFERVLWESASRNRQLQDAQRVSTLAEHLAGAGHFRFDQRTLDVSGSPGLLDLYQINPDATENGLAGILRLHDESDQARIRQMFTEVVQTRAPVRLETRCKLTDGRVKHVLTQCNPEFDADGEFIGIIGVSLDMSDARRREAALSESEARLRLLADNISDIVIWVSPGRRILYASPSIQSLGFTPDSLLRQPLETYIHPEDRARADQLLDRIFEEDRGDGQLIGEFRFLVRRRMDEPVWLEGYANAIRDPEGRPRSAVINFRDVTQRRKLEEDLRLAKTSAEATAQAKSEFLANMSHELRTPLTGVIGFTTLLAQTPDLPDSARAHIRKVISSGEALLSVVNDILDFSKLEAGQVDLDPSPFHLRDFLEEVLELFKLQADAKGLQLDIQIQEPMPDFVLADRARVRQVLFNLLSNALKFTEAGSVRVHARHERVTSRLDISVADTGVGVAQDQIERLFERFSQADGSIGRRYGGSGLGLSICRQLTHLMGGGISGRSTLGVGSEFSFNILAPRVDPEPASACGEDFAGTSQSFRILVVDDVDANRELVRAMLESAGQVVEEASGGQQAVSLAVRESFDLILMDLQMPGMDGFATARAIRELSRENRSTPIVALSANVLPEHVAESRRAGMNDHIAKPIVPSLLITTLNRWAGVRLSLSNGSPEA